MFFKTPIREWYLSHFFHKWINEAYKVIIYAFNVCYQIHWSQLSFGFLTVLQQLYWVSNDVSNHTTLADLLLAFCQILDVALVCFSAKTNQTYRRGQISFHTFFRGHFGCAYFRQWVLVCFSAKTNPTYHRDQSFQGHFGYAYFRQYLTTALLESGAGWEAFDNGIGNISYRMLSECCRRLIWFSGLKLSV